MDQDSPVVIANQEAEEAVLAACLFDREALLEVADIVKPDMFYLPKHRLIYQAILQLLNDEKAVDLVTVCEYLRTASKLTQAGGPLFISQLANCLATTSNVMFYVDIIREKATRRRLITAAREITALAIDEQEDWEQQVAKAEHLILEVAQEKTSTVQLWGDILEKRWDELYESRHQPEVAGLQTGFIDLDIALGGLQNQELIILAARPSQGKTTLAQNIIENVAGRGKPVYFVSLEMGRKSIADRAISSAAMLDSYLLRSRKLTEMQWNHGSKSVSRIMGYPIYLDDDGSANTLEIRSRARRIKSEHGLAMVAIDYLQLINDKQEKGQSRNDIVGKMARGMKAMAMELDVPVLVLSQLNRAVESRADKAPVLSDLRESGDIEQAADVVLFIHRPDHNKPTRDIIISKQRNGPTGKTSLYFDSQHVKFKDLQPDGKGW